MVEERGGLLARELVRERIGHSVRERERESCFGRCACCLLLASTAPKQELMESRVALRKERRDEVPGRADWIQQCGLVFLIFFLLILQIDGDWSFLFSF